MNFQFSIFNFQKKATTFLVFSLLFVYFTGCNTASASMFTRAPNNFGLVGYWSMEDGKGATVTDFSGKNHVGTMTNMDPANDWVTGKIGKALDFDGTNDRVVIGGPSSIYGLTTDLSVFAWVKTTDTSWEAFGNGAGGNGGWGVSSYSSIGASGRLSTYIGATWRFSSSSVNDGTWHHVGYTLSSSSGGTLQFYVDGAANGSAITSSGAHSGGGGTSITIGDDQGNAFPLSGQVDEARIYNRALSSADVLTLYNFTKRARLNGRAMLTLQSGLSSYWKMDEVSGNRFDTVGSNTLTDNSTVTSVAGKIKTAGDFTASNGEYLSKFDTASLEPGSAFTFSAWVYQKTNVASGRAIFSKWDGGGGPILHTSGSELKTFFTGSGSDYAITSGLGLTADTWYHVAQVFDGSGSTNADKMKFYVNGVNKTLTFAGASIPTSFTNGTATFEIGNWSTLNYWWNGYIDEVGFWQRALTQAEITTLYNGGNGLTYPFQTATVRTSASLNTVAPGSLVNWHTFDGSYLNTTTSTDRGSGAKNLTLSNGPRAIIGKVGQGMYFDGVNDTIYSSSPITLADNTPWTISLWMKPTDVSGSAHGVYGNLYTSGNYTRFDFQPGNTYELVNDANGFLSGGPSLTFTANQWQHIVIVCDGTDSSNISFYQDGVYKGAGTLANSAQTISAFGDVSGPTSNYPFIGSMDDIRIYNKALSATEVLALYNQTK